MTSPWVALFKRFESERDALVPCPICAKPLEMVYTESPKTSTIEVTCSGRAVSSARPAARGPREPVPRPT